MFFFIAHSQIIQCAWVQWSVISDQSCLAIRPQLVSKLCVWSIADLLWTIVYKAVLLHFPNDQTRCIISDVSDGCLRVVLCAKAKDGVPNVCQFGKLAAKASSASFNAGISSSLANNQSLLSLLSSLPRRLSIPAGRPFLLFGATTFFRFIFKVIFIVVSFQISHPES